MPHNVLSDLGLQFASDPFKGSRLEWVKKVYAPLMAMPFFLPLKPQTADNKIYVCKIEKKKKCFI